LLEVERRKFWDDSAIQLLEREAFTNRDQETALTLVWSAPSQRREFHAVYHMQEVHPPLAEWVLALAGATDRKVVYPGCESASRHGKVDHRVLNPNGLQRGPHRPRTPGLALCDFYLFGSVKGSLQRSCCDAGQHLLKAIDAAFLTTQTVNREDVLQNEGERSGDDAKARGGPRNEKKSFDFYSANV
jgi:hypothetical protein